MIRGYLWTDLRKEIDDEFRSLIPMPSLEDISRHIVKSNIFYTMWAGREAERLPEELRKKLTWLARSQASKINAKEKAKLKPKVKKKLKSRIPSALTKNQISYLKRKEAMREKLEDTREGITHHFTIYTKNEDNSGVHEVDGYIQTGLYKNGRLGEVFVKVGKQGDFHALVDQWAIAVSVALQYGAPMEDFLKKFVGARFEPSGATTNKEIPRCTSIVDYTSKWLLHKYCNKTTQNIG